MSGQLRLGFLGLGIMGKEIEYIEEDELIEVTPAAVRLRKRALGAIERKKMARAASKNVG